jgi:hypothetical protein
MYCSTHIYIVAPSARLSMTSAQYTPSCMLKIETFCESATSSPASAYVSIRQQSSAYVSIRQHTSAYVGIRQHTSA